MADDVSRRALLGAAVAGAAAIPLARWLPSAAADPAQPVTQENSDPEIGDIADALAALRAGNQRFVDARMDHSGQDPARRIAVSQAQHPFATVLSCSDSRLPPEVIFDQGLGDLFVVRVAGNIVEPAVLGSIEYAVGHLHTPLVLVLGHQNCGAVAATLEAVQTNDQPHGDIAALVAAIEPTVPVANSRPGDLLDNTIHANAEQSATQIIDSPELQAPVHAGQLKVMTGYYSLDTGVVTIY